MHRSRPTPPSKPPRRYASSEWDNHDMACQELYQTFSDNQILCNEAIQVYREVEKISHDAHPSVPIKTLTKILKRTKAILKGPDRDDSDLDIYREHIIKLHSLAQEISTFPKAKILAGVLLCLLGVIILIASGIIGAVAFGLTTPINILTGIFGISLVWQGAAAVSSVIGASCLMFSAPVLTQAWHDNPLWQQMKKLESTAKRVYDVGFTFRYF